MSQDQHPVHSPEREALRDRHGVRAITSEEEGQDVFALPDGVYGFTGAPAAREMPLFTHPIARGTEVHKSAHGEIYLIGYVQPAEKQTLENETEPAQIRLFPEPQAYTATLVAVPLSRIERRHALTRENGNPMVIDIAPRS